MLGRRVPLHCTAAGQVLLAHADSEVFERVTSASLMGYTPATLTRKEDLAERCRAIRREGIVRFAECTSPGEARDQSVWVSALNALD